MPLSLPAVGFWSGLLSLCLLSPACPSPLWPWTVFFSWAPVGAALVLGLLAAGGLAFLSPLAG